MLIILCRPLSTPDTRIWLQPDKGDLGEDRTKTLRPKPASVLLAARLSVEHKAVLKEPVEKLKEKELSKNYSRHQKMQNE